jgi:nucleoside-diphosphate-sugar epimerase
MKVLFIGGTGTISAAISRRLLEQGCELYLLNRGNRRGAVRGKFKQIRCDINNEDEAARKIGDHRFDVVADFIAYNGAQLERDYRLFKDRTGQFIFISSASAYQKPLLNYRITESAPLANPYWEYSRNKIAGEDFLVRMYRENGFPITIVRPSHTYDERRVPLGVHGAQGSWQVLDRMLKGKPVIIHGDGTSLWTLTHARDFARAFTGLMGNAHAIGQAVHITSDEVLTWNLIYRTIAGALGAPLKAVHVASQFLARGGAYDFTGSLTGDKANSVVFDNAKLKELVPGFTAEIRFDQGIRETIAHIRSHRECRPGDPEFDAWCDRVITVQERAQENWPGRRSPSRL